MRKLFALMFAMAVGLAPAQAADSTVSGMTAAGTLTGAELLYCVQSAADRKCTATQVAAYAATANRFFPGYKVSNWYIPFGPLVGGTGSAPGATTITYCTPAYVPQTVTISDLGVRMTTQGSSNIQLAVYNNDSSIPNRAGTLVGATGDISNNISPAAISGTFAAAATFQLTQNTLYWFCLQANDTTGVYTGLNSTSPYAPQVLGSATLGNAINASTTLTGVSYTGGTYGTWPNFTGVAGTEVLGASLRTYLIGFKVSSVP